MVGAARRLSSVAPSLMGRACLGGALALFTFSASAQSWDTQRPAVLTATGVNQATLTPGASVGTAIAPRSVSVTGSSGVVSDIVKGPHPNRVDVIDVEVRRPVNWAKAAKGIARTLPGLATAIAVAELLEEIRCREGFGGPECDLGQDQQNFPAFVCTYSPGVTFSGNTVREATDRCAARWLEVNNVTAGTCKWEIYTVVSEFGGAQFTYGFRRSFNGACGSVQYANGQWTARTSTALRCPDITVGGQTITPLPGRDNKCPTGVYAPSTVIDVESRIVQYGDEARMPAVLPELIDLGIPIEHNAPTVIPPSSIFDGRVTRTNEDGSTTVTDRSWTLTPTTTGYQWVPRVSERTFPPGSTIPGEGEDLGGGTTTEGGTPSEFITCGLPGTPPCKIDESGTPPAQDPFEDPDSWFDSIRGVFDNPDVADTQWTWSFSLPSHCSALPVGIGDYTVTIDLCQYQPIIHDILSMVWIAAGIWFAIGLVGRTLGST